ncbi:MAG: CD225/dispanin family protein [Nitrospiraceae bacterium]|nr:CD225/dispanin family protein [Nitrospiraceae bacterium]
MFCTKCGTQNEDNAFKCIKCGNALQRTASIQSTQSVPNYLAQAILVTIFCCLPFGIPAIVFAAQVNGKLAAGDYNGALETSKKAKMWCWVSFWVGLGVVILYLLALMIPLMLGGSKSF